jgi:hypothetical protein
MESLTAQLKQQLRTNGFKTENNKLFYRYFNYDAKDVKYTFLGGGWVEKYVRCYPAKEGWTRDKYRISEFFGKKARSLP